MMRTTVDDAADGENRGGLMNQLAELLIRSLFLFFRGSFILRNENCQTTESTFPILEREGLNGVYQRVVDRASLRSERYIANEAEVGIIITTLKGEILAMDKHAKEIGELEQWHIPCIS